jgi:hypothetical protein
MYSAKIPTANAARQLGTGYVDHSFLAMASNNIGKIHLDFNLIETVYGQVDGHTTEPMMALAASVPLSAKWTAFAEPYGGWMAQHQTFTAARAGAGYRVRPRLVLDAAIDAPISGAMTKWRLLAGMTYAIHRF